MLPNVKRATICPIIEGFVEKGSIVNTDEYGIYNCLPRLGYLHSTVCHSQGEYARDDMEMVLQKCMLTPSKDSGPFYVLG